eukprot:jgi/Ulvmu1/2320/UM013_0168.1
MSPMKEKNQSSFLGLSPQTSIVDAKGTLELDTSIDLQADLELHRLQIQQDMQDTMQLMKHSLPVHVVLAALGAALFWTVSLSGILAAFVLLELVCIASTAIIIGRCRVGLAPPAASISAGPSPESAVQSRGPAVVLANIYLTAAVAVFAGLAVAAISMWHHFTQNADADPAPTLPGAASTAASQALLYATLASCVPLAWLRLRTHMLGADLESLLLRIAAATFSGPAAAAAAGYLYVILTAAGAVGRNALVLDNSLALLAAGAALVEAIVWRVAVAE